MTDKPNGEVQEEESVETGVRLIPLGGQFFRVIDFDHRTVLIDHYLMKMIRKTGADRAMPMDGEHPNVFVIRLQCLLIDSGLTPELLAGYLVPQDITEAQWTPTIAKQTAKFIGQLNTKEDREMVATLSVEVAFGFFKQGLEHYARSQNSFQKEGPEDDPSADPSKVH